MKRSLAIRSAALALAFAPATLLAQLAVTPPLDALDQLNGASTGPSGGFALDRTRNVVANVNAGGATSVYSDNGPAAVDPTFNAPANPSVFGSPSDTNPFGAAGPSANPFGAAGPADNPFGATGPADNPFGAPNAAYSTAYAAPATLSAWGGERIMAHGTGQVLQDARSVNILATASGNYFDDGQNGNDAIAGDNIYTNITVSDDYISPEAQLVKSKIIQTLQYTSSLNPQRFFQVPVATTEPTSPLPQVHDLEERQDAKLTQWMTLPLAQFRVNPDDKDSEFYPTYLPPPPRAPNIPLPINFTPKKIEQRVGPNGQPLQGGNAFGEGGQASAFDASVTGEPVGNASSRYF